VVDSPCPHCGELHAASVVSCPKTGAALPKVDADSAPFPDKGVADILKEAYGLYRRHARALLLTCAVMFVPAAVVKSCAVATIMGPTLAAARAMQESASAESGDLGAAQRALQQAYQDHADGATIARLQADHARALEEVGRRSMRAASAAMGSFTFWMLRMLGALVTFFIYAVTVPLTNGALTIAVADRVLGGDTGWREVWMLLLRRLGPLLTAILPAALLTAFGLFLFIIPGLVLGLLFAFVSPVVLVEGLRGRAALRRSIELVGSDWLRVTLMLIVLAVLSWVAQAIAHVFVPSSALFFGSLMGDLVTLLFLPLPVLGMVLLYFDIRRRREGFTDARLRADLDALKTT
jgi:type II secretory pathway pseudopilin PulG